MDTLPFQPPPPVSQGSLLEFVENPVRCMSRLHNAHGDAAALEDQGQRINFVFSPALNKQVLSDGNTFHSKFFSLRGPKKSAHRRVTSGLLSMNGGEHKEHRRLIRGPFGKTETAGYYELTRQLATEMLSSWSIGETIDLSEHMKNFMRRLTSAILFGLDYPELAFKLGHQIDRWVELNHQAGMLAFISDGNLSARYEELLERADELETDLRELIRLRRESENAGVDVLSLLLRGHGETGMISDDQLIGHITLTFGAAHLTTADSLTWWNFLVSQHPSIGRAVLEEVDDQLAGDYPTLEEAQALPIFDRSLQESMRILPASAYSQRVAQDFCQLGRLKVAPGMPVIFTQYVTHHRDDVYPEPETFRPERWIDFAPPPYAYIPFGGGARLCLGAGMAMQILKCTLPAILKQFCLVVEPGCEIDGRVIGTMMGPRTPLWVRVEEQNGQFATQPVIGNIHDMVDLPDAAKPLWRAA